MIMMDSTSAFACTILLVFLFTVGVTASTVLVDPEEHQQQKRQQQQRPQEEGSLHRNRRRTNADNIFTFRTSAETVAASFPREGSEGFFLSTQDPYTTTATDLSVICGTNTGSSGIPNPRQCSECSSFDSGPCQIYESSWLHGVIWFDGATPSSIDKFKVDIKNGGSRVYRGNLNYDSETDTWWFATSMEVVKNHQNWISPWQLDVLMRLRISSSLNFVTKPRVPLNVQQGLPSTAAPVSIAVTSSPSAAPSTHTPTEVPSDRPSSLPTSMPSYFPSSPPSAIPSFQPSNIPTNLLTAEPSTSVLPSTGPSSKPSLSPTGDPTSSPSSMPSLEPSAGPSESPSSVPSSLPSSQPSSGPSSMPSSGPSSEPSSRPSLLPTVAVSSAPSSTPTQLPSADPTLAPSSFPSQSPSGLTGSPSRAPVPSVAMDEGYKLSNNEGFDPYYTSGITISTDEILCMEIRSHSVDYSIMRRMEYLVKFADRTKFKGDLTNHNNGYFTGSDSLGDKTGSATVRLKLEDDDGTKYVVKNIPLERVQATTPPTSAPVATPTTSEPSYGPSLLPSQRPSYSRPPSASPSKLPSASPSKLPSVSPSTMPSGNPTASPATHVPTKDAYTESVVGFAAVSGSPGMTYNTGGSVMTTTTGGEGGTVVTVTTAAEFDTYIDKDSRGPGPYIVQVQGMLISTVDKVYKISSDTTIVGVGSSSGIVGGELRIEDLNSNIIIRNLVLDGGSDNDAIQIKNNAHHIWIDHCYIDGTGVHDGCLDIKDGSDLITVSWVHFFECDKTMLIGHDDNNSAADFGKLRTTIHHCYFERCRTRSPRVRYANPVHIYNCYFEDVFDGVGYAIASAETSDEKEAGVWVEWNHFLDVDKVIHAGIGDYDCGHVVLRNNVIVGSNLDTDGCGTGVNDPSNFYGYTVDEEGNIDDIVRDGVGTGIIAR